MDDERLVAFKALLDAEERIASAERAAYARGMTPTADELHQVLRNVIALRRKLNLEVPEGKISPVETSPHSRDFDFQFDGENLVVSGTGLRGIYQQRVPLPLLIQLVEAAQSLREPFTVRDVEQLLVKHHNAAPPQYTIYATLRFLEAYEFCEKVGRGRYALRKFSQGELRTRVHAPARRKIKLQDPPPPACILIHYRYSMNSVAAVAAGVTTSMLGPTGLAAAFNRGGVVQLHRMLSYGFRADGSIAAVSRGRKRVWQLSVGPLVPQVSDTRHNEREPAIAPCAFSSMEPLLPTKDCHARRKLLTRHPRDIHRFSSFCLRLSHLSRTFGSILQRHPASHLRRLGVAAADGHAPSSAQAASGRLALLATAPSGSERAQGMREKTNGCRSVGFPVVQARRASDPLCERGEVEKVVSGAALTRGTGLVAVGRNARRTLGGCAALAPWTREFVKVSHR